MAQPIITKKKVVILFTCLFILLYLYLTAERFFHLALFRWYHNKIVTIQISGFKKNTHQDIYAADVSLKMYKGKWQWLIGDTCATEIVMPSTENAEEMNNWSVAAISMNDITLQNAEKKITLAHRCG